MNDKTRELIKEALLNDGDLLIRTVRNINSYNGSLDSLDVYENDESTFDEILGETSPHEVARQIYYGEYEYNDDYFRYNGYGNLESLSESDYIAECEDMIDEILDLIEGMPYRELNSEITDIMDTEEEGEENE